MRHCRPISSATPLLLALAAASLGLSGCGHNAAVDPELAEVAGVPRLDVPAGQYVATFDAARDVLRDLNFTIERVDAQAGVIATQQKGSAGVLTPWDQEQSSFEQEAQDALQRQKRSVRIEFVPASGDVGTDDLRALSVATQMRVSVDVYRWQQSGWRLNTQAILYSTYSRDPQADARGLGSYGVAIDKDDALARRIIAQVRQRLASTQP